MPSKHDKFFFQTMFLLTTFPSVTFPLEKLISKFEFSFLFNYPLMLSFLKKYLLYLAIVHNLE